MRFEAYGWGYLRVEDETNVEAISQAIAAAQAEQERPTFIEIKTTIGYGSPNKAGRGGHDSSHGVPLGTEEVKLTKHALDWPQNPLFFVPEEVRKHFASVKVQGEEANKAWVKHLAAYKMAHPELGKQLEIAISGNLPEGWDAGIPLYSANNKPMSTRTASQSALNTIAKNLPFLIGGAADLESST
ncbi:transketolase, partial [Cutibacterium acnes]